MLSEKERACDLPELTGKPTDYCMSPRPFDIGGRVQIMKACWPEQVFFFFNLQLLAISTTLRDLPFT